MCLFLTHAKIAILLAASYMPCKPLDVMHGSTGMIFLRLPSGGRRFGKESILRKPLSAFSRQSRLHRPHVHSKSLTPSLITRGSFQSFTAHQTHQPPLAELPPLQRMTYSKRCSLAATSCC